LPIINRYKSFRKLGCLKLREFFLHVL
jgi:hypothetical protein